MQKDRVVSPIFLLIAVAFLASFYFFGLYRQETAERAVAQALSQELKARKELFDALPITASVVLVYDYTSDTIIYAKNPFEPKPLASLAKLATAFVSLETLDMSATVSIDSNTIDTFGETQFMSGEKWLVEDLIDVLLVTSSNIAADALMDLPPTIPAFPRLKFMNTSGLDEDRGESKIPGAIGSAYDITRLAGHLATKYPERMRATTYESNNFDIGTRVYHAKNTNEWISKMPNLVFSKTGYTNLAGGNLIVGYYAENGHLIIITVLGSTKEGRFEDVHLLLEAVQVLFPQNQSVI